MRFDDGPEGPDGMSGVTGYEYRRHLGCNHPVREHKELGCVRPHCDCGTSRSRLQAPVSPFLSIVDWLCKVTGAVWITWHVGGFLVDQITRWFG